MHLYFHIFLTLSQFDSFSMYVAIKRADKFKSF